MPEHRCDECGRTFPFPHRLRAHELVHTDDRPFECGVCGDAFRQVHALNGHHKRLHSDAPPEDPHPCTQCPKVFKRLTGLRRHMAVHVNSAPVACPYCAVTFARKSTMLAHARRHGPMDELQCVKCKRPFGSDVAKLTLHAKTHLPRHKA